MSAARPAPTSAPGPGLRAAIDYGPLALFFAVNFLVPSAPAIRLVSGVTDMLATLPAEQAKTIARVLLATAMFMVATVVSIVASRVKLGRISPMLWISGGLVVVFGALTLYFRDPRFLQMKPTIVYATFAAILGFGLATDRSLLEGLLGGAYPGLTKTGWRKLTRNWALFFVVMSVLNEIVWRTTSWDFWVGYKLWGAIPLTMIFAIANVPMLRRHGLQTGDADAAVPPPE